MSGTSFQPPVLRLLIRDEQGGLVEIPQHRKERGIDVYTVQRFGEPNGLTVAHVYDETVVLQLEAQAGRCYKVVASGYLLRESETKERLYFKPTVFDFDFPQGVRLSESKTEVRREKEERDFWFQYALYEPSKRTRLCIAFHCVALGADTAVPFWETRLEIEAATGIVIEQSFFTTRPEEAGYRTGVQSNYSTAPFTEVSFADPARAALYNTFIFQNIRALRDQPAGDWDYRKGFMTLFGMAADADGRPSVFYYANDPTVARLADGFGAGRAGLPFFDVLSHLLDIACSVEYLHAHGVIHGSISFETIVGARA